MHACKYKGCAARVVDDLAVDWKFVVCRYDTHGDVAFGFGLRACRLYNMYR